MGEKDFAKIKGSNPFGNQMKLLWHHDKMHSFLKTGSCFPIQIELNATNVCNLACKWCISDYSHKPEALEKVALKKFLREFKDCGGRSISWTGGGEPTCHKDIKELIEAAAAIGLRQGMMTNGLFNPSLAETLGNNLEWIRISLDTADRENYKEIKGVDGLNAVLNNIRLLTKYKARVVTNINLSRLNFPYILETTIKSKELGANGIQIRPVLPRYYYDEAEDKEFFQNCITGLDELKKIEGNGFQVFISYDKFNEIIDGTLGKITYDSCQYHNFICALNADGNLCVCMHHLGDGRFNFGNIYNNSFREIWESGKRKEVMDYCLNLDFKKCQVCCKGHEINKFLQFLQRPDPKSNPDFF